MTAELPLFLQILIALGGLGTTALTLAGTAYSMVKTIASWGESRAKIAAIKAEADLTKAKAQAVISEAEAKKIVAAATAADLDARSKAEVIAADVRAQDVGTRERQAILKALEVMMSKVEAVKVTQDTTLQGVILANQQLTVGMDKTNRHPDSPMTPQQADAELAKHQATDKAVAEGAQAPAPIPPPEPTTPPLTVAVQTDEKIEIVSGNAVVITGASETPIAPVQPEVPKKEETA